MSKYSNKWTKDEADLAIKLSKEGLDSILISKAMYATGYDRSPSGIRHFLQRINRDNSVDRGNDIINKITSSWPCASWLDSASSVTINDDDRIAFRSPVYDPPKQTTPSHSADHTLCDTENGLDCWNALTDIETERQRLFNMITEEYAHIGNPKGKLFKVISISDLHIPFVNDAVIKDMMEKHSDADILVVNGDLLEQYSVSKWPKSKGVVLKHEYQIAVKYIKMFASQFKKVVLTRGNHDERVAKYFASNIDPGISFLTHPDPLERISNGFDFTDTGEFKQIHSFDNVFYFGGLCGWYAKVGKTIFAHPSGGSGVPMRTGVNVTNYFIEKEDFDCVVCAHTHKLGAIVYKGKLIIEQGCACIPMDYEADSKMQYGQQSFGYAVIYMNAKGEVDFDKSRPVYYGTATCVDTDVRLNVGD
jgi:predicted phosphodiesterase